MNDKMITFEGVSAEQMDLVRRTIAPGATPDELHLFMYDCQRQGVHPLDKMIHFTKRSGKYVPIASIDFLRSRAESSGEYAGNDDAKFEYNDNGRPESATITVWKMVSGQRCAFSATARWNHYYPGEGKEGFMWRKMPEVMLAKCAEALALRKAFPRSIGRIYAAEEMDQATESVSSEPTPVESKVIPYDPALISKGKRMVEAFKQFGVTQHQLEEISQKPLEHFQDEDFEAMSKEYKRVKQAVVAANGPKITDLQFKLLMAVANSAGIPKSGVNEKAKELFGLDHLHDLNPSQFQTIIDWLKRDVNEEDLPPIERSLPSE